MFQCCFFFIASDPVQNLEHTIEYADSVQYEPKLTLTFETPCRTNGTLIGYNVRVLGERSGKEPHEFTQETNDTTYTTTLLRPDYAYTVSVSVLTEGFQSEEVATNFVSQAGGNTHSSTQN